MSLQIRNGTQRNVEDQPVDLIYDGGEPNSPPLRQEFKYAHDPVTSHRYLINADTENFDASALSVGDKFQAEITKAHFITRVLKIYPASPAQP